MILLVDDEPGEMTPYIEELSLSGYEVEVRSDVDQALEFLQSHLDQIDLLVLDIMLPPGSTFEQSPTDMGLRTGLCFYDRTRDISPLLPVLVLTNVSAPYVRDHFRTEAYCWFVRKEDCLPYELAEKVSDIYRQTKNRQKDMADSSGSGQ